MTSSSSRKKEDGQCSRALSAEDCTVRPAEEVEEVVVEAEEEESEEEDSVSPLVLVWLVLLDGEGRGGMEGEDVGDVAGDPPPISPPRSSTDGAELGALPMIRVEEEEEREKRSHQSIVSTRNPCQTAPSSQ
jgi:hypothetical protein